ncbi:hypothetical protein DFJ74DRAFT_772903 [Hyaloraphidium curvatum]|nr:hypothetical protein DFJ74DRAFT_772903 [Hyaloraphidium curvatum]
MKVLPATLLALLGAAAALAAALPAAAQGVSPNTPSLVWVKAPTCNNNGWGGGCCCPKSRTVISTKYRTRTAVKTLKRTRTVTRTVTTTSLNRRRLEARDGEAPFAEVEQAPSAQVLERDLPEPEPAAAESPAEEVVEEPFNERSFPDETEDFTAPDGDEHNLYARQEQRTGVCGYCPQGVVPAASGSGNTRRCCRLTKVTSYRTRTKTTTRIKTTTVKTTTKTVTRTVTQPAAVVIPVFAFNDVAGDGIYQNPPDTPRSGALVVLNGPTRRLGARQTVILGQCITLADGRCTIRLPTNLNPGETYAVQIEGQSGALVFKADASGQPPAPPGGGDFFEVSTTEITTVRLGRRELVARAFADQGYRRALKARATPGPEAF